MLAIDKMQECKSLKSLKCCDHFTMEDTPEPFRLGSQRRELLPPSSKAHVARAQREATKSNHTTTTTTSRTPPRSIRFPPPIPTTPTNLTTMSHRQGGGRNKVLLPPINFIFKLLQQHSTVQIWLYEQLGMRIEGKIRGFDEFMNLVIDDAVEVKQSTKQDPNPQDGENGGRRELGEFILGSRLRLCFSAE